MKKTIFAVMLVIGLVGVALQVAYANNSMVHIDFDDDIMIDILDFFALIKINILNYEYKCNDYLTIVRVDRFIANYFRMLMYLGYYGVAPFILKFSGALRKAVIASLQIKQLIKKL